MRGVTSLRTAVRDALIVLAGCTVVGVGSNALRAGGIPLVQRTEYQILVPCPEGSDAQSIPAVDPLLSDARTLLVDARAAADHQRWHPPRAMSVPFDYLEPTCPELLRQIAASRAARVVVFGDGASPDSGEHLAREIAGRGIRNVRFVEGGAPALQKIVRGGL